MKLGRHSCWMLDGEDQAAALTTAALPDCPRNGVGRIMTYALGGACRPPPAARRCRRLCCRCAGSAHAEPSTQRTQRLAGSLPQSLWEGKQAG